MKKGSIIFLLVMTLFIGAYTAYNIYLRSLGNFETQYALISNEYETVEADCFVIRDEKQGNGKQNSAIIKNSGQGVYIPYVEDGSRVAAGDTIALFFKSEDDAMSYREEQSLMVSLDYYKKLQSQSVLSTLDVDKLEKTVNDNIISMVTQIEKNDYTPVTEIVNELKYDISAKKIATGKSVDFSKQISSIEKKIKKLSRNGNNYKAIKAPFPGCYISRVDGFESALDYKKVSEITSEKVKTVLSGNPSKVSDSCIGKIISGYNWYAVCNVPKKSLEKLSVGKSVCASFEDTNVTMIEMKVFSISPVSGEEAAVVLTSNRMDSDIALLRKEKIKIVLDEFEGLRVPREAIRNSDKPEDENTGDDLKGKNLGVYIQYGQVVKFRRINVLYYGDNFVIAERETGEQDSLKLYDMIITKGRNLYDGKLIG